MNIIASALKVITENKAYDIQKWSYDKGGIIATLTEIPLFEEGDIVSLKVGEDVSQIQITEVKFRTFCARYL